MNKWTRLLWTKERNAKQIDSPSCEQIGLSSTKNGRYFVYLFGRFLTRLLHAQTIDQFQQIWSSKRRLHIVSRYWARLRFIEYFHPPRPGNMSSFCFNISPALMARNRQLSKLTAQPQIGRDGRLRYNPTLVNRLADYLLSEDEEEWQSLFR